MNRASDDSLGEVDELEVARRAPRLARGIPEWLRSRCESEALGRSFCEWKHALSREALPAIAVRIAGVRDGRLCSGSELSRIDCNRPQSAGGRQRDSALPRTQFAFIAPLSNRAQEASTD